MRAKKHGAPARGLAVGAAVLSMLLADASFAGDGSDCPPNAEPGKCYEKVYLPEQYETYVDRVLEPQSAESYRVDAVYRQEVRRVLVRAASTETVRIPAVYRTVTETVVVRPAAVRRQLAPAEYDTITEQVMVSPAHTEWRRGTLLDRTEVQTGETRMLPTGEVLCLVEVAAQYRTQTRQVLRTPAHMVEITEPAETQTVSRQVLVSPERTEQRVTEAEYRDVVESVLVSPAHVEQRAGPPVYRDVVKRRRIREASFGWQVISCDYGPAKRVAR